MSLVSLPKFLIYKQYRNLLQKTNIFPKNAQNYFHLSSARQKTSHKLKTPELIYFPQILRWLRTKIGFKVLQKAWDPDFSEGAFIYGSTRAICRITELISSNDKNDELKDLVTPILQRKLHRDINGSLSNLQKKIIMLTPKDIKLLIPMEVRLSQKDDKKMCMVGLRALAVKWQDLNGSLRLAIIALQTEFVRDYTNDDKSEWTLRLFDILECGVVGDVKGAPRT